jgi:predicted outer membrane repeat protein
MTGRLKYVMGIIIMGVLCTTIAVAGTHAIQATLQSTFLVTNLNDSGPGSLRQAILNANTTPGEDFIHIFANGQLNLLSPLPTITEAVTILVEDSDIFRVFKIDGQNAFRGLTIANVPVTITGLTVQNAVAFGTLPGGGITSDGDLILNNVHVLNNSASLGGGVSSTRSIVVNGGRYEGNIAGDSGGAIYAEGALIVNGSTIQNNQCLAASNCEGGGLYAGNTLTLTNTQILSNTAQGSGGGLFADDAVVITGTLFLSNTATGGGGGGAAVSGPGSVQVTNSRFENNQETFGGGGGGLFALTAITATLNHVDFVGNESVGGGAGLRASDVRINGGSFEQNTASFGPSGGLFALNVVLTNTRFISNTDLNGSAGDTAGGAYVSNIMATGGSFEYNVPGGLRVSGNMDLTGTQFLNNSGGTAAEALITKATNVLFANNSAVGLRSGGFGLGQAIISDSQFVNNGGGIVVQGPLTVTNSLFINNPSGSLRQYDAGDVLIANTLFASNTVSGGGTAVFLAGEGTATLKHVTLASSEFVTTTAITTSKEIVLVQNTIVANHDVGLNVTTGFVALSHALFHDNGLDIQGSVALDENRVTGDPLFVNPGAGDFHLQVGSAAIDAGVDAGITADFEGEIRPSLNGFDVGYDEFVPIRVMLPIIMR